MVETKSSLKSPQRSTILLLRRCFVLSCPICKSKEYEIVFRHARLANVRRTYTSKASRERLTVELDTSLCKNCGFLYRTPLLSEQEQREYYESEYYETYKPKKPDQFNMDAYYSATNIKKNYSRYLAFLRENNVSLSCRRILDIGTGRGGFLLACQEENPLYLAGIEPSKAICEQASRFRQRKFDILNGLLEDYSVERIGSFDLITMIGVIEHLSNPREMLTKVRKYLTDDGHLFIYTHDESPNIFHNINRSISLVHQLYFTEKTMSTLMNSTGFSIVKMQTAPGIMYIIATKGTPPSNTDELCPISNHQYLLLKHRYQFYKKLPSLVFDFSGFLRRLALIPRKFAKEPRRSLERTKEFVGCLIVPNKNWR